MLDEAIALSDKSTCIIKSSIASIRLKSKGLMETSYADVLGDSRNGDVRSLRNLWRSCLKQHQKRKRYDVQEFVDGKLEFSTKLHLGRKIVFSVGSCTLPHFSRRDL